MPLLNQTAPDFTLINTDKEQVRLADHLGKKIVPFNIRSLNISIGQCGSVAINLKFESSDDLKKFESQSMFS